MFLTRILFIRLSLTLAVVVAAFASTPCLAQIIYNNNFDQHTKSKKYRVSDLDAEWNHPEWQSGVSKGRVKIKTGYQAFGKSGACLAVKSKKKTFGPNRSGAQWQMMLDDTYEEVILSYHVKFKKHFDFVRGGKLPGLAGGTAPTGNVPATGTNGWAARMMWRTDHTGNPGKPKQKTAQMISYAKYVGSGYDQQGRIEDETYYTDEAGTPITIKSNVWYQISQRIRMNDPAKADGVIQIWLDGNLVVDKHDVRFRTTAEVGIDQVYFSHFFGGDYKWRTVKWATVYFDNFSVLAVE